jgi:CubicO group peptidase (beta-lactamase class C family)
MAPDTCAAVAHDTGATSAAMNFTSIDSIVQAGIDKKQYPGAVLVIGRKSDVLYQKAYGRHTFEPDAKPMTIDTLFDLASVTKVVATASTAMALVEDGKINLDATVGQYLDGFSTGGKESARVRDLLTHVSGLKAYDSVANAEKMRTTGVSSADALLMRIASLPASNAPRTTTTYSCLNMLTQARVNENVLGGRQDDYITSRLYSRLGMKDTTYLPTDEQLERTAPSVRKADGSGLIGKVHDPLASYHSPDDHCPGNAGLFSTAPDLARFCEMTVQEGKFKGQQVYKPETIRMMTAIQTPPELSNVRGLGWDIYPRPPYSTPLNNVDGKRVVAHTGYTGTMLWLDMNTGAYMVFLTNRTYPDDSSESGRGVSRARREIIEMILRSQPEYQEYFASLPPGE